MKFKMTIQEQLLGLGFLGLFLALVIGGFGFGNHAVTGAMNRMGVSATALRYHLTADMMHDALKGDVQSAMIAAGGKRREEAGDLERTLRSCVPLPRTVDENRGASAPRR